MKPAIIYTIFCLGSSFILKAQSNKTERPGQPAIYKLQNQDIEMDNAINMAIVTFEQFKSALLSGNSDYSGFAIKVRFDTPSQGEHIWITDIRLLKGKYYGMVSNEPEITKEVKYGELIEIKIEKISDWMYIDKNKLRGGFTLKLLRNRMTEEERKKFDTELGILIDE